MQSEADGGKRIPRITYPAELPIAERREDLLERYLMDLDIEYFTMLELVDAAILPAASGYLGELASSVAAAKAAGLTAAHLGRAESVSGLVTKLCDARETLCKVKELVDVVEDEVERANRYAYELMPAMDELRSADWVPRAVRRRQARRSRLRPDR